MDRQFIALDKRTDTVLTSIVIRRNEAIKKRRIPNIACHARPLGKGHISDSRSCEIATENNLSELK
jgi:hypothetical protein